MKSYRNLGELELRRLNTTTTTTTTMMITTTNATATPTARPTAELPSIRNTHTHNISFTRHVSENLVNCYTTVGTSCATNPQQKRSNGVRALRSADMWQTATAHRRLLMWSTSSTVDKFCWQHERLVMTKFSKSRVWDKVPKRSALILQVPEFPYGTMRDEWKESFMPKPSSICVVV